MRKFQRRLTVFGVVIAAGAAVLTVAANAAPEGGKAQPASATREGQAAPTTPGAPKAKVVPQTPAAPPSAWLPTRDATGTVPWDMPLLVNASNARIGSATATDAAGTPLPGAISADKLRWQSSGNLLPQTAYTVKLALIPAVGNSRRPIEQTMSVTSAAPTALLRATLSPNDGEVVGVGMPIGVNLNRAVDHQDRPALEQRLSVTTNPPVEGAWRWLSPTSLHWRPAQYWASGTEVTVVADLTGLQLGRIWGTDTRTIHFRVGDAHISTVDVNTHQMTVTNNGEVVNVVPVSTGRRKFETRRGVHIVLLKEASRYMDSATLGVPRNAPGGYYKKTLWNVRMSNSGTFVHAAPWSVGSQGRANVSHGCINVSTNSAKWFYDFTQRGDIVDVINSPVPARLWDPGTADWNMAWEQWKTPPPPPPAARPVTATGPARLGQPQPT